MATTVDVQPEEESVFAYRHRQRTAAQTPCDVGTESLREKAVKKLRVLCLEATTTIHPLSSFKRSWEHGIALLVVVNSMIIPWQIAFKLNKACQQTAEDMGDACISPTERVVGVLFDAVFWIDMLLSFRSGFVDKRMMIRMNGAEIVQRYLRFPFWLELFANFPYDALTDSLTSDERGRIAMNLCIVPKLLRVVRPFREASGSHFSPSLFRIFKMVAGFLVASHWCGCLWYFIGRWEAETVGANVYTGNVAWIEVPLSDDDDATYLGSDLRTKYTAAVYWAITTMSTVGYGDILPRTNIERVFTMVVMFLGATSAALILGNVAVLIANFNNSSQRFREKRYELDAYLKAREISPELCRRARTSLHYAWNQHRGIDHETLLQGVPQNVRREILLHIHTTEISGAYLFNRCDRPFIRALVVQLLPETYAPKEVIYREGDVADGLYYVKSGKIKLRADGVVFDVLSDGDLFGETELFTSDRRPATLEALTAAEVQRLTTSAFQALLEDFHEYKDDFRKLCRQKREAFAKRRRGGGDPLPPVASPCPCPLSNHQPPSLGHWDRGDSDMRVPDTARGSSEREVIAADKIALRDLHDQIERLNQNMMAIFGLYFGEKK